MVQNNDTVTLYRSTNDGASFSPIKTWTTYGAAVTGCMCLSVWGFPNELWVAGTYSANSNDTRIGLWHITGANTATPTLDHIACPVANPVPYGLTLGAPAIPGGYPTLYLMAYTGYGTPYVLYEGTYSGSGTTVLWTIFGPTGTKRDLPDSCQIDDFHSIHGDYNTYRRLYVASNSSGLAYYNP
jgi:hypothetical protein